MGDKYNYWEILEFIEDKVKCLCLGCNKTKILKLHSVKYGRSKSCGCQSMKIRKETNLKKYGVEHAHQNKEISDRKKATDLKKFGGPSLSNNLIREKAKKTMLEKFGVEYYSKHADFNQKKNTTMIEKFGVEHYTQSEQGKQERSARDKKLSNGKTIAQTGRDSGANATTLGNVQKRLGDEAVLEYCKNYKGKRVTVLEMAFIELMKDVFPSIKKYDKSPEKFKINRKPDFRLEKDGRVLYINVDGFWAHIKEGCRDIEKDYHYKLFDGFREGGQSIYQFHEDEVFTQGEIVRSVVCNYFGIHKLKVGARKCIVQKITGKQGRDFF